jgi:GIY-YIG catalytic domain
MIYLGMAGKTLRDRLLNQDLRHKQPSSFFRSLGCLLGFTPPPGSLQGKRTQNNYKFSPSDTREIIGWIDTHLSIRFIALDPQKLDSFERTAIFRLRPLLNIQNNPEALPQLEALRKKCRHNAQRRSSTKRQEASQTRNVLTATLPYR